MARRETYKESVEVFNLRVSNIDHPGQRQHAWDDNEWKYSEREIDQLVMMLH